MLRRAIHVRSTVHAIRQFTRRQAQFIGRVVFATRPFFLAFFLLPCYTVANKEDGRWKDEPVFLLMRHNEAMGLGRRRAVCLVMS